MGVEADELRHWLRLALTSGIGGESASRLLDAFGSPEAIFRASQASLARTVGDKRAQALCRPADEEAIARGLEWAEHPAHHLLTWADADFPRRLLEAGSPPPLLYLTGRRELLARPALAMVGSRTPSPQGEEHARHMARKLSRAGVCIVSGMAAGIDAAAHEGALGGEGSTIAVVGTGADIVYPRRNIDLAVRIAEEGLILSEFPLGTPPAAGNFPRRNRLIAGLGLGCLVVEASQKSGSLITARLAGEQGRDVFAIPGSIDNPMARGCHKLIREGAKLVESVEDILEELHIDTSVHLEEKEATAAPSLDEASGQLLNLLGFDAVDTDTLCRRSGLTPDRVCAMLVSLELSGHVASLAGGRFQRISD